MKFIIINFRLLIISISFWLFKYFHWYYTLSLFVIRWFLYILNINPFILLFTISQWLLIILLCIILKIFICIYALRTQFLKLIIIYLWIFFIWLWNTLQILYIFFFFINLNLFLNYFFLFFFFNFINNRTIRF